MSNFDLIDDYLTNRLSERERKNFEEGMNADPALKSEMERQGMIVEGIRKARAAELKSMLNKVPIDASSLWSDWSIVKIAATIGITGLVGTGLYFFTKDSETVIQSIPGAEIKVDSLLPKDEKDEIIIEEEKTESNTETKESSNLQMRKSKPKRKDASSPKLEVADPSEEMLTESNANESVVFNSTSSITVATIQVSRRPISKEYPFHYQFSDGKLFLYGAVFEESLYEILEVHGDNHALFMFFKDNFYFLDDRKQDITELTPLHDRPIIQKLKEFRSGK